MFWSVEIALGGWRRGPALLSSTPSGQNPKRAVEMAGLWKAWKAKGRLPPLSTAPWKSRQKQARFPHFHSSGDEGGWKSGKPKAGFPLSHRLDSLSHKRTRPLRGRASPSARGGAARPPQWSPVAPPRWETFTPPLDR